MGASHYMPALRSERICDYWACMVLFIPARSDQRFHSRRCKDLDRAPMIFERPCGACSRLFRPKRNAYAVFCSKGCNQRARRASLNGPRSVLKTGVADRDGWICRIPGCGLPVERGMRFPDPWSPSVDHVIPVSFGGGNDPENLRLAHLVCNMRRGVRPL
jgi:hypothetical protein